MSNTRLRDDALLSLDTKTAVAEQRHFCNTTCRLHNMHISARESVAACSITILEYAFERTKRSGRRTLFASRSIDHQLHTQTLPVDDCQKPTSACVINAGRKLKSKTRIQLRCSRSSVPRRRQKQSVTFRNLASPMIALISLWISEPP